MAEADVPNTCERSVSSVLLAAPVGGACGSVCAMAFQRPGIALLIVLPSYVPYAIYGLRRSVAEVKALYSELRSSSSSAVEDW
jgi:hypothetical protein